MRKATLAGGAVFGLLLVFWIAAGAVVWSRNSFTAPKFPPRPPFPAGNAYKTYTDAVSAVKSRSDITTLFRSPSPGRSQIKRHLNQNASVLKSLREAGKHPSMVTELEPGVNFVAAIDFPHLTRLMMLDSMYRLDSSPETALEPMLDGIRFSEGVMRGGAMLHVLVSNMAYAPIFQGFPQIVGRVPADACRKGADELLVILRDQASLDVIVKNEHAVRFRQLKSTFPAPASVFMFGLPWDRREFALIPKAPAVNGLNRYFTAWASQADRPIGQVTPPDGPSELKGILNDDSMGPEEMGKRFLQFYWRSARLRIVYTALRLEQWRNEKGRYPAALRDLMADRRYAGPFFTDPFSGNPLIYRRDGAGYTLYSVGPNGIDDGGIAMNEAKLNPRRDGDLLVAPTFGRR